MRPPSIPGSRSVMPTCGQGGFLGMALAGCGLNAQAHSASSGLKATATGKHSKSGSSSSVPETTEEKLAERAISAAGPAVVEVTNVGVGLGSGVILSKAGDIVTNNH